MIKTPVKRLTKTPIPKVKAKPRTRPNWGKKLQFKGLKRIKATARVVKFASFIASKALPNPRFMAISRGFPLRSSSFILSEIKIFESTAIPIDRINPAIPGKVEQQE